MSADGERLEAPAGGERQGGKVGAGILRQDVRKEAAAVRRKHLYGSSGIRLCNLVIAQLRPL